MIPRRSVELKHGRIAMLATMGRFAQGTLLPVGCRLVLILKSNPESL